MVARADAVVEHVRSGDTSLRLKAVREMKNQVVGSRSRKLQFLKAGAVPHLVAILATDGLDPSLIVQVPTCPHRQLGCEASIHAGACSFGSVDRCLIAAPGKPQTRKAGRHRGQACVVHASSLHC